MDPQHTVMIVLFFALPITFAAFANIAILVYFFSGTVTYNYIDFAYGVPGDVINQLTISEQRSLSRIVLKDTKHANINSLFNVTATCGFLALTWLTGYFVLFACTDDLTKTIFAYLFILLNATQGVSVLVIHLKTLPNGFRTIIDDFIPRTGTYIITFVS